MQDLVIPATSSTPALAFKAAAGTLRLAGESFPEHAARFYAPALDWVRRYMADERRALAVDCRLNYFNTSSSKCIMDLFDLLDQYARGGARVRVNWHFAPEDDDLRETGEELAEAMHFEFHLCPAAPGAAADDPAP